MVDIFFEDVIGPLRDRLELARKATAEAGGPAIGSASNIEEKRRSEEHQRDDVFRQTLTALQTLMQDPIYRAAYERCWVKLEKVQSSLDVAILENASLIEQLESKAARLDDGTLIFLAEDGQYYRHDGSVLTPDEVPNSISQGATSWEAYRAARKREAELARIQSDTLDPIYSRMQDQDNPPSKDELGDFEDQLDRAEQEIEASVVAAPTIDKQVATASVTPDTRLNFDTPIIR